MRFIGITLVLIFIGCSFKGDRESTGGMQYTLTLNKYKVNIGEQVQIFFSAKNLEDTTVTLNIAGWPEYRCDVFRNDTIVYYEPLTTASLAWSINFEPHQERNYETTWNQTSIVNGDSGPQVPAGEYRIHAYLSGYQLPILETSLVITE